MSPIELAHFKRNDYSQFGEDGILERLLAELGVATGTFCEFGAWDGRHLSNTRRLYEQGWRGIFIEGDVSRFEALKQSINDDRAELICAFVQPDGNDSLEELLRKSRFVGGTNHLDVLSIDIDSDDLAVWQGLKTVRPRVVIIEFNPTIPIDVHYVNPRGQNKGNSAAAILGFASTANYDLVAATDCNLFFVDAAHRPQTIPRLAIDRIGGQRYFWGYDGTLVVTRTGGDGSPTLRYPDIIRVPWKGGFFAQPTPSWFRGYEQGKLRDRLFWLYSCATAAVTQPFALLRAARSVLGGQQRRPPV